jgi:hypothetical protein
VARDPGLEELLHEDLGDEPNLSQRPMFGGLAWLLGGNLLCAARDDGMLARLGKDRDAWALEHPDVRRMVMQGRAMSGWVKAGPEACADDDLRRRLLQGALAFCRELPPKTDA